MYQFLKETEKIPSSQCPREVREARKIIYQHYSSLCALWLDCEGDFLKELQNHHTLPFLEIHIIMALSLYQRFDLLEPFLNESILTPEKRQRFQERARLAFKGKEYLEDSKKCTE